MLLHTVGIDFYQNKHDVRRAPKDILQIIRLLIRILGNMTEEINLSDVKTWHNTDIKV